MIKFLDKFTFNINQLIPKKKKNLRNVSRNRKILFPCYFSTPPFLCVMPLKSVWASQWTRTLNRSLWRAMLRYQAFHMTLLTQSFYALLHPDSIKNGLTPFGQDWRPFYVLSWTTWLMGSPAGLSVISLKTKFDIVCERESYVYC